MSDHVGVIRSKDSLTRAVRAIANLERQNSRLRFDNILTTAKLMTVAALQRTESRGGHYRSDCPEPRPEWKRRTYLTLAEADRIVAEITETEAA
jgi:L-aspartate oxidase